MSQMLVLAVLYIILIISNAALDTMDVSMPGITVNKDDNYMCTSSYVKQPGYVVRFHPTGESRRSHHMLLYGCRKPAGTLPSWECLHDEQICKDEKQIIYAWAINAPEMKLPDKVGVYIGGESGIDYIVLQAHYGMKFVGNVQDYSGVTLDYVTERPHYLAGIYLMKGTGAIPPHLEEYRMNVSCKLDSRSPISPFAFRTHSHSLGVFESGYFKNASGWEKIGTGNPQLPEVFYPAEKNLIINPGDTVAVQCIFNSTTRDQITMIGMTVMEEMCNYYIYYYAPYEKFEPLHVCSNPANEKLFEKYPSETEAAAGSSAEMDMQSFFAVDVSDWLHMQPELGQIGGLATDVNGFLYVFHRAKREWTSRSFDERNQFTELSDGPIQLPTLLIIDPSLGTLVQSWGGGIFYMPHGVFVDHQRFVWFTDVAMHQVFKYDFTAIKTENKTELILALGTAFAPGSDKNHFCKPAAVIVIPSDGSIFVADGYCNGRIVKFDAEGRFIAEYGEQSKPSRIDAFPLIGTFNIPHALSYNEDDDLIYIADRENARVQILSLNGSFQSPINSLQFGDAVFSVFYCKAAKTLFVLNGHHSSSRNSHDLRVFAVKPSTKHLLYSFAPKDKLNEFIQPHALAVSSNGTVVFVGEIGPNRLWNFNVGGSMIYDPLLDAHSAAQPSMNTASTVDEKSGQTQVSSNSTLYVVLIIAGVIVFVLAAVTIVAAVWMRIRKRQEGPTPRKTSVNERSSLLRKRNSESSV